MWRVAGSVKSAPRKTLLTDDTGDNDEVLPRGVPGQGGEAVAMARDETVKVTAWHAEEARRSSSSSTVLGRFDQRKTFSGDEDRKEKGQFGHILDFLSPKHRKIIF